MKPNKVGRPAMDPDEKRKARSIKMTDVEWAKIKENADASGMSISEFIRVKAGV